MSATLGGLAAVRGRRVRRVADALTERLSEASAELHPSGRLEVTGRRQGLEVRILHLDRGLQGPHLGRCPHTVIGARLPAHLRELQVGAPRHALVDVLSLQPVTPTGDDAFDRRTAVRGPDEVVGPALTEAARALLAGLVHARRGRVGGGWVEVALPGHERRLERLEDNLDLVARVARALAHEVEEAPERLERIAQRDGLTTVRELALLRLVRLYPGHAATDRALASALASDEPRLGLIAAHALPPTEGTSVARSLLADPELDPEDQVRALGLLVRLDGDAEARRQLRARLESGSPSVQVVAAEVLAEVGGSDVAASLHALAYRVFTAGEVRRAALRALDRVRARVGVEREGALSLCGAGSAGAMSLVERGSAPLPETV